MTTTSVVGAGQSQELEVTSKSPTWMAGVQTLEPSSVTFPGALSRAGLKLEQPGFKPVSMQDALTANCGTNHGATTMALTDHLKILKLGLMRLLSG